MNRPVLLFFCCVTVVTAADAGPWVRKAGKGYVQLGFSTIGYNKVYDDGSRKQSLPVDVRDNVVQFMGEVGLTDNLTAFLAVPLEFLSLQGTSAGSNSGLGDVDLGLKYAFINRGGVALSGEALFSLPVGSTKNDNGLRLGDGEFNTTLRVLAGLSFYPVPVYLSADLGSTFAPIIFRMMCPSALRRATHSWVGVFSSFS